MSMARAAKLMTDIVKHQTAQLNRLETALRTAQTLALKHESECKTCACIAEVAKVALRRMRKANGSNG